MDCAGKSSRTTWAVGKNRLRALYIALCIFQLVVMSAGLLVGYRIEKSYSTSIENEIRVNAQRRELIELAALADAAAPPSMDADDIERDEQISSIQSAATLFISKVELLIQQSSLRDSPLSSSGDEFRKMVRDMGDIVLQVRLAAQAREPDQVRAHLMYADRALTRVRGQLGNVNEEALRVRDEILKQQTIQSKWARTYLGPLSALAGFLVIPAVLYARSLDKQALAFDSQLQAERDTLEDRVEERTVELRREIDQRSWMEQFNRNRNRLLEMVARGRVLPEVLEELASAVEHSIPGARCIVVIQRGKPVTAFRSALPQPALTAIMQALTAEAGLLGRLRQERRPLFLSGLDDRTSSLRAVLRGGVVQALWAVPVMAEEEKVVGALMMVWAASRVPEPREEELLSSAARIASIASAHAEMQEELFRRAHHDPLTGLPNRILCEDRLQQAFARGKRNNRGVGLLCIDLDDFKHINDQYGHQTGDWLLEQISGRLSSRLRSADTVARIGGDEFLAIIEDVEDSEAVETVTQNILSALNEPFVNGNTTIRTSASIGAAIFPADGSTPEELKNHADQAMYRAKEHGRATYCMFSAALSAKLARRRQVEQLLRKALENNGFELYYQPQYTPDRELCGLEALLRFRDPALKGMSPAEFIGVAERAGLIHEVGDWVLAEVCRQARLWNAAGIPPTRISINVSALQLGSTDFADRVSQLLCDNSVPASWLQIELTETAIMSNPEESSKQLTALERLGVRISIDDFGTGYSSLAYIQRFPVDTLKVDRSFIQRLPGSQETQEIVRAITAMARALGLSVVAEGVETQDQMQAALSAGCDMIQGFLLSRPMTSGAVYKVLMNRRSTAQPGVEVAV